MIGDPSLAELKNNSERSRAELAATVHQLRHKADDTVSEIKEKVSVPYIKQEIKGYVGETRDNLIETLKTRAKENPLQAVAVGVGIAYPLLGLIKRIPVPLMLAGAGFWLAQKNRDGSVETDLTKRATEQAGDLAAYAKDQAAEGYSKAADAVSGMTKTVSDVAGNVTKTVSDAASDATKTVSDAAKAATGKARAMAGQLTGQVSGLADDAGQAASSFGQKMADTANQAGSAVAGAVGQMPNPAVAGRKAKNALIDFVENNALLVAGAGLALGAFVAASVPRSEVEDRLAGKGSDFVKKKVRETAAEGFEQATRFAAGVVGEAVASAAQQGLNSEAVTKAVDNITAGIKSVATKGAQAAFGDKGAQTEFGDKGPQSSYGEPARAKNPSLPEIK